MSYQVLARKWRPRRFAEMVGQEHVLRALINALDNDRLHHAFLFTGTRGVGKTTIARILAKSLNCDTGVSSTPCGECSACREIDEGRFVDLIEVDAASRTKVEDTRELLENVQYAPTRGRYKVYLIDEVHMLSTHSFNALLKTLEEPPPHVKFLLATTDPQKLPVTILSRCLQFNLKRLPLERIAGHLEQIAQREGIDSEPGTLGLIARAADGSMRDALSLLDQAIAYGGGALRTAEVRAMLGTIDSGQVLQLLQALADHDAPALLEQVAQLAERAPDFAGVLAELISTLHRIALAQLVPNAVSDEQGDAEAIRRLAEHLSAEDVQLYYQIALLARRDLPLVPEPRSGLEMALLRMLAFRPAAADAVSAPPAPAVRTAAPERPQHAAPEQARPAPVAPAPTAAPPHCSEAFDWNEVVKGLGLGGLTQQLAVNCSLAGFEGDILRLALQPSHSQLLNKKLEERLQQALQDYLQRPVRLTISVAAQGGETPAMRRERDAAQRQQQAVQAIETDANVSRLVETFDAQLNPESIQPR